MANMKAKVELLGSETLQARGRTLERGKPVIITNPSDIRYYQSAGGVSVTMLDQPAAPKGKPAKPKGKPAKPKGKPAPVVEDDEDDDTEDTEESEDDDTEDTEESEDDDTEGDEESDDDSEDGDDNEESGDPPVFSKAQLAGMSKSALVELAKEHFELELSVSSGKDKLVAAVLKEQIARANG